MNWSLRLLSLGTAILASVFVLNLANAGDQSITGKKLLLKPGKLVLISKDPIISTMGSDAVGGADSSVSFDLGLGDGPVTFDLPKANWSGSPAVFKYKNKLAPSGPSAVKVAKVKAGLIKVVAKGLPFPVPSGAATINIVFNLDGGTNRYCATFTGTGDGTSLMVKNAGVGAPCPPIVPTPTPTVTPALTATPIVGTPCSLACPGNDVLIGVSGQFNGSGQITQIQGKCGAGTFSISDLSKLYFNSTVSTATCGDGGGDPFVLDCPANKIIRAFDGRLDGGGAVIGLSIACTYVPLTGGPFPTGGGICMDVAPTAFGTESVVSYGAMSGTPAFAPCFSTADVGTGLSTTAGTVLITGIVPACTAVPDPICTNSCS